MPVPIVENEQFGVTLDGFTMRLRQSELESVVAGLGEFDSSAEANLITLIEALRRLPTTDRAPTWELAVRRYGRHRSLPQAAGEIGMDLVHASELVHAFARALAEVPPPEHVGSALGPL
jgi:hypothetical protein